MKSSMSVLVQTAVLSAACAYSSTALADDLSDDNVLVSLSLEDLLNIEIVSASKIQQKASEAPATIRVITNTQIRQRGYRNLDDALKDVPGIDLTNIDGAYPYIHTIRGSFGDENRRMLLMIDGIVENSLNGSFEMAGPAYSLHNVERIEVIYGPASALYGANAYSGLINIITKQGESHRGFDAKVGVGNFDTESMDIYWNVGSQIDSGTLDFAVNFSLFDSDGDRYANRHPDYSAGYVDEAKNLTSRLSYQTEYSKTTFGLHYFDNPMGIGTFGNSYTQYFGLPPSSELNPGTGGYLQHPVGGAEHGRWHSYFETTFLQHEHQITDDLSLFGRLQYRETGLEGDSYSYSRSGGGTFFNFRGKHESDATGAEIQATYLFGEGNTLIAGFQYSNADLERGFRPQETDGLVTEVDGLPIFNYTGGFGDRAGVSAINRGYYAQAVLPTKWLGETDFTIGLRYDDNTLYGTSFTPRVGAVNKYSENLTFKLLYGEAFRAPTPFELFGSSVVRIPNPQLEPELVDSLEFSATWNQDNYQLIATVFNNKMDSVIVEGVPVGNGKFQIQNIGKATIRGIELEGIYFVSEQWQWFANVSWQNAKQDIGAGEVQVPNVARFKANLSTDYRLADDWHLNARLNWVGDRTVQPTNPLDNVESYHVINLSLTKERVLMDGLSLQLTVGNLFNKGYEDPGIKSGNGDQWGTIHEQPGRSIMLSVSYKL